ncbi:unnamed protein product [Dicrocoelium dendriticum]|nr:unnamed protein product [Dicrocoelium dendriticum]
MRIAIIIVLLMCATSQCNVLRVQHHFREGPASVNTDFKVNVRLGGCDSTGTCENSITDTKVTEGSDTPISGSITQGSTTEIPASNESNMTLAYSSTVSDVFENKKTQYVEPDSTSKHADSSVDSEHEFSENITNAPSTDVFVSDVPEKTAEHDGSQYVTKQTQKVSSTDVEMDGNPIATTSTTITITEIGNSESESPKYTQSMLASNTEPTKTSTINSDEDRTAGDSDGTAIPQTEVSSTTGHVGLTMPTKCAMIDSSKVTAETEISDDVEDQHYSQSTLSDFTSEYVYSTWMSEFEPGENATEAPLTTVIQSGVPESTSGSVVSMFIPNQTSPSSSSAAALSKGSTSEMESKVSWKDEIKYTSEYKSSSTTEQYFYSTLSSDVSTRSPRTATETGETTLLQPTRRSTPVPEDTRSTSIPFTEISTGTNNSTSATLTSIPLTTDYVVPDINEDRLTEVQVSEQTTLCSTGSSNCIKSSSISCRKALTVAMQTRAYVSFQFATGK